MKKLAILDGLVGLVGYAAMVLVIVGIATIPAEYRLGVVVAWFGVAFGLFFGSVVTQTVSSMFAPPKEKNGPVDENA